MLGDKLSERRRLFEGVLDVFAGLLCRSFGLVEFAFRLEFFVICHFSCRFLRLAGGVLSGVLCFVSESHVIPFVVSGSHAIRSGGPVAIWGECHASTAKWMYGETPKPLSKRISGG